MNTLREQLETMADAALSIEDSCDGRGIEAHQAANQLNVDSRISKCTHSLSEFDIKLPQCRTEVSFAKLLLLKRGSDLRYCGAWEKWLVWDGTRWRIDDQHSAEHLAAQVAEQLWQDTSEAMRSSHGSDVTKILSFTRHCNSSRGIEATLRITRSDPRVATRHTEFDSDPWLFNVANGTIDLRSGELKPPDRRDLITKFSPVSLDTSAVCPRWISFLDRVTDGNKELQRFLQLACGMSLSGEVRDHILLYLYGTGANGKSVFLNTMLELFGPDYGRKASSDLLVANKGQHQTGKADLWGKRFVVANEIEDGGRLNEAEVKQLTGGDPITARRMREDFWQFDPTHTLWLAANHKLDVRGTDEGIWRRVKLIAFTTEIPESERDPQLLEKLKSEMSGILNWTIEGCLEWQRKGLSIPDVVASATTEYRVDQDAIQQFIDERCRVGKEMECAATILYEAYCDFCKSLRSKPVSQASFGTNLETKGYIKRKSGCVLRIGIDLVRDAD